MDQLVSLLPLVISAAVPPLIAVFRSYVAQVVPDKWIPVLLPIGGGIVGGLAHLAGTDASVLQGAGLGDATAWQTVITGITSGFASIGVHQLGKQLAKTNASAPKQGGYSLVGAMCLALVASVVVGCAALGLPVAKTFNERLAAGYSTVTAIRNATSAYIDAKVAQSKAEPDVAKRTASLAAMRADVENVQAQADEARRGLDVAAQLKGVDLKSAESRLSSTLVILQALQTYLGGRT